MISNEKIDQLLVGEQTEHKETYPNLYIRHYLEQYRIYLRVLGNTAERRQQSNEFFLGINTAIMAILGYIETKEVAHSTTLIFTIVPFIGIVICRSWWQAMQSYRQLAKAKFRVIHRMERKLPAALFETEWEILGRGKKPSEYYPLSLVEKNVPLIFILLYLVIFFANSPFVNVIAPYFQAWK